MAIVPKVTSRLRSVAGRLRRTGTAEQPLVSIDVVQEGRHLNLRLGVARGTARMAILAERVGSDEVLRLAEVTGSEEGALARIDLLSMPRPTEEGGARYLLRLESERRLPEDSGEVPALRHDPQVDVSVDGGGWVVVRTRMPLGRARRTSLGLLDEIADGDLRVRPYVSGAGILAVAVNSELAPTCRVHVSHLSCHRGILDIRGSLGAGQDDVLTVDLVLKGRVTGRRVVVGVAFDPDRERTASAFGLRWYRISAKEDWHEVLAGQGRADDTYDAWVRLVTRQHRAGFEVRVGRTRLLARRLSRAGWSDRGGRTVAVTPYYTFKAKRTSFIVGSFDTDTFEYLRRQVRLRHVLRAVNWRRDVWIVGERPYKAQDTGYWFFRYLRENHPQLEAYYVIERDSPERANVEPLGNVVEYGSKEHVRLVLLARTIAGSHHPSFLYPLRTRRFEGKVRAARIFLQHGVMGTKWMANLYGKGTEGFDVDLFIVSSEREREYIHSDFGYGLGEIAVTGLSRFDSLFAGDVEVNPRQVLIMPTWRDWLQDADLYRSSDYHRTWSDLLHSPDLRELVDEHSLEVVFCLHPNMQQYVDLFQGTPARVISQGEADVQLLLKQSAMLITDYSSVGFDFSFLNKPIVYFQFDRERFLGIQGSHLDLFRELPGPIVRSPSAVLSELAARLEDGFSVSAEYSGRAERFLAHRDRESSRRIYEAARATRHRRRVLQRVASSELTTALPRFARSHRVYFPVMRRLFSLAKWLPADRQMVLFESGLGKQFADSPRYIYEELVRSRPDLVKVWSYSGRLPVGGPDTRVVARMSPRYFWYLARAKYWVNNQSFPHYVTRRPDGVYVQTWHGTPLKRMLHDLSEVHGRDLGYVDRATQAARQWSILVSPNSYTSRVMRSAFRYVGEVLEVGYPRNDVLHSADGEAIAARVRASLGLHPGQRAILYAPTFRDDRGTRGTFGFELPFALEGVRAVLGDHTVLLVRTHVLVSSRIDIPIDLLDVVRDVSQYPDIQELFLISDALITDYSSVFFDYASLRRPIVFYAHDLDHYRDTLRGFYLDYETELPGAIARTEQELIDILGNLAEVDAAYAARREAFVQRFCPMDDGSASRRVVEAVFGPD